MDKNKKRKVEEKKDSDFKQQTEEEIALLFQDYYETDDKDNKEALKLVIEEKCQSIETTLMRFRQLRLRDVVERLKKEGKILPKSRRQQEKDRENDWVNRMFDKIEFEGRNGHVSFGPKNTTPKSRFEI